MNIFLNLKIYTNDKQLFDWWKKWIDFIKLSFIQMKILNEIACTLNLIETQFNSI